MYTNSDNTHGCHECLFIIIYLNIDGILVFVFLNIIFLLLVLGGYKKLLLGKTINKKIKNNNNNKVKYTLTTNNNWLSFYYSMYTKNHIGVSFEIFYYYIIIKHVIGYILLS